MLVLTRKVEEKIRIGQDITITVVRIKGNSVRIGIEAPQSVRVTRPEAEAKQRATAACSENNQTVVTREITFDLNETPVTEDATGCAARTDSDLPGHTTVPSQCLVGASQAPLRCASYGLSKTGERSPSTVSQSDRSNGIPGRSIVGSMRSAAKLAVR